MRLAAVLLAALAACGSEHPSVCTETCEKEARCIDEHNETLAPGVARPRFDAGECAAACKALERDKEGKGLVKKHADCVAAALDRCDAVLACP